MKIVLISGKRFSGKNSFAQMLKYVLELDGRTVHVAGFADAVKAEVARVHGLDYARLCADPFYKEEHRSKLIAAGMEGREADPDYWVEKLIASHQCDVLIIADWRFPNEAAALADYGPVLLRVEASAAARAARGWCPSETDAHESEIALDTARIRTIPNDGGRRALCRWALDTAPLVD